MINIKDGEVKVGDAVVYNDRLGYFESLHENQMNVRFVDNNELLTLPLKDLRKALHDTVVEYLQGKSKQELLIQLAQLTKALAAHDVTVMTVDKSKPEKDMPKKVEEKSKKD